jgi:ABC-type transport system involved in Fe-S cluster assembly fused permease/ATPase subunit
VWNDDATAGDAIGILGTGCFDLYSGSVASAGIQLRDLSQQALESAVFPDPLDISVFPDEYRVVVGYSFPTALYANITQMPEPEAGAAAATALLALAIVLPARTR